MDKIITEEIYTVYKKRERSVTIKDFENFEEAYEFFKKDKEYCIAGHIAHSYKVSEIFFDFDKVEENK
jgi:hypothetical protein